MDIVLQGSYATISPGFPHGWTRHGSYDGGVKDPRRLPVMTDALTRLWEARPDLTLTRLLGLLETHGADWSATDEETLAVLRRLAEETPARLDDPTGRYLVTTENSAGVATQLVTVGADRVAVRQIPASRTDAVHDLPQPVVWEHSGVRSCHVAAPLVITDTEGIAHRMGLVSSIRVIAAPGEDAPVTSLDGLRRRTLDGVYLLELEDASLLLDRTAWLFTTGRRDLHRERLTWARLLDCTVGAPLRIALDGGEVRELPELRRITVLE